MAVDELRELEFIAAAARKPYSAILIKVGKWLAAGAHR